MANLPQINSTQLVRTIPSCFVAVVKFEVEENLCPIEWYIALCF